MNSLLPSAPFVVTNSFVNWPPKRSTTIINKKAFIFGAALSVAGAWLYTKRATSYERVNPELRAFPLRFRSPAFTPGFNRLMNRMPMNFPLPDEVQVEQRHVSGPSGAPDVPVYIYRPHEHEAPSAALLYIHGGGYVVGAAAMFHAACVRFAKSLGIVVVSVDYRLAPDTPFPGPLEDCYAALKWMAEETDALGIDAARIGIAGDSAGGGLAAALAQLAHDRGEIEPAFQLLIYPMLDDRTCLQSDHEGRGEYVWTVASNRLGWSSYLSHEPGTLDPPPYAVPARREDLAGLPPAWIGVGTLDLFYPEAKAYAQRLAAAGVPCEYYEVEGAYHASEFFHPNADVSKAFVERSLAALRAGLDS